MARPHNAIRFWALLAVALTSAAMIGFGWWLIDILAAPNWCNRAMGAAEDAAARPEFAVGGCFELLRRQVDALALNSHFAIGTLALSLAVLVVIVLAGGRVSFKASASGVEGDISGKGEVEGARRVAAAANEERREVEQDASLAPAPKPTVDEPEGGG